jgi:hypothetical protein
MFLNTRTPITMYKTPNPLYISAFENARTKLMLLFHTSNARSCNTLKGYTT